MLILTTDSIYSVVTRFFERISRRRENPNYLNNKLIDAEKRYINTKKENDKQKANDLASKVGGFIIRI